jgi:seryl-tRNA synthetase
MLDLKALRSDPGRVRSALARRGSEEVAGVVDRVLELDEVRRAAITESDALRAERNEVSRDVGRIRQAGGMPRP